MHVHEADPQLGDFDWQSYVAWLAASHGTLTAVATVLAAAGEQGGDVLSIERGLRRLRSRGTRAGGRWGERCLQTFGLPSGIESRLRWMGHFHSRFTDLPRSICQDLLQPWQRPPITESLAIAWVQLGLASVALRGHYVVEAEECLNRAESVARGAAQAEALLVRAYVDRRRRPDRAGSWLDRAEEQIRQLPRDEDRACLWARLVDQRAAILRRAKRPEEAEGLYASLPRVAVPPFVLAQRHAGLGWCALAQGHQEAAVAHARVAAAHAGDVGSLRMRAATLDLLARATGGEEGEQLRLRAIGIANRLEDEALRVRVLRQEPE